MVDVIYEAGTLTASREDRIVSGLLVPYGEIGRTNLGRFSVEPGAFEVPEDVSVLNANLDHDREQPIARWLDTTDTPAGRRVRFQVAAGVEGDALLAEIDSDSPDARKRLSVEAKNVVIRAGKAIKGRIFGAAFVKAGAFPSAALYAADTEADADAVGDGDGEGDVIEVEGVRYRRIDPQTTEGEPPSDEAPDGAGSEAPMAEDTTAPEVEQEQDEKLYAAKPGSLGGKVTQGRSLFASLAGKSTAEASTLMAALDQMISTDVLPAQQKQWLGEVYGAKTYVRKFAPLIQHADLNAMAAVGFKFTSAKTPEVAAYAGYPNQPNSNEVKTEAVTLAASRLAGAGAVDRAFLDFPTPEFWTAYFREQTNHYEKTLDGIVRDALVSGATAVTADSVPSGVATAASYIVDGASAIIDADRDLPTFAIVGSALWRALLKTRSDDTLAYLSAALGVDEGDLAGFRIIPSSATGLVGKVLVGTRSAATLFELPGTPVRVDALSIATGGVERGVFGYHAELINDALGLSLVAAAG